MIQELIYSLHSVSSVYLPARAAKHILNVSDQAACTHILHFLVGNEIEFSSDLALYVKGTYYVHFMRIILFWK